MTTDNPQPVAHLVIDPLGGVPIRAWLDRDRAHEFARNTESVVVDLPIVADYRPGTAA